MRARENQTWAYQKKLLKVPQLVKAGVLLPPAGWVWHAACFWIACELRMVFDIFQSLNKTKKVYMSWRVKITWNSNFSDYEYLFIETQLCLFVHLGLWLLSCCNGTETTWPSKLQLCSTWPFKGECVNNRWSAMGQKLTRWYGDEWTLKGILVEVWRRRG